MVRSTRRRSLMLAVWAWLALALLGIASDAAAQTLARTALVIGNGAYDVGRLRNPPNDAADIAKALQALDFEVILHQDVGLQGFDEAVLAFKARLQRRGGIGLFYYAGHAIEVGGRNYLIPVNTRIRSATDVKYRTVNAGFVLGHMDEANAQVNIIILDACRDNPYERRFRSVSRGIVRMELPRGKLGSIIAYATAPGRVAQDGTGRNSPFTGHLLETLRSPGLTLEQVFKTVRIAVNRDTRGEQTPWSESALLGDIVLLEGAVQLSSKPPEPFRPPAAPPPSTAQLTVRSNVTGDTLYIDGQVRGPTGPKGYELAPGRYTVRVEKPGYESWERTVTLAAGERETVRAKLVRVPVEPPRTTPPEAGETWTEPMTGMELVWVPEGCFQMGSEQGESHEKPVHRVCVKGFWLGKHEVTQAQWLRVMGSNPARLKKGDDHPVEQVSWKEAHAFIAELDRRGRGGFRLPSEAEWEYACRSGGRAETYCGGETVEHLAWYGGNSSTPQRVGRKRPNGLNVHDMSGNVWEWVQDCWNDSYAIEDQELAETIEAKLGECETLGKSNPWRECVDGLGGSTETQIALERIKTLKDRSRQHARARDTGRARTTGDCTRRVTRGGSWNDDQTRVRAAVRNWYGASNRFSNLGFRLARTP